MWSMNNCSCGHEWEGIYTAITDSIIMTRITSSHEKNTTAALTDLFEMSTSREPAIDEIGSLLEMIGTHGSMIKNVVVYENEEVYHVYTKNILPSAELKLTAQY